MNRTPFLPISVAVLAGAAREAALSRIFAGQHFRFDLIAGQQLGRAIADLVVDRFLIPLHGDKDR